MAWTIIRQPNGKLMIWSSVVDEPVYYDITEEEYIEIMANEARDKAKSDLKRKSFVKDPLWINSLVCAYGKDTEKLDELVGILGYVGYDTKKIRNILNDQLAEELEDEETDGEIEYINWAVHRISNNECNKKLAEIFLGYDTEKE